MMDGSYFIPPADIYTWGGDMAQPIGSQDQPIGGLDQRIGGLDQRIGGLDQRIGGLDQRIGGLDQRIVSDTSAAAVTTADHHPDVIDGT